MSNKSLYQKEVSLQVDRRKAGVELIKVISDLWYDKSIEMVLFKNQLLDKNVSDIINLHQYAGEFVGKPISIFDSVEIAKVVLSLDLPPAKIDLGKLTYEYRLEDEKYPDARYFVIEKLKKAKSSKEIKGFFDISGGEGSLFKVPFSFSTARAISASSIFRKITSGSPSFCPPGICDRSTFSQPRDSRDSLNPS